MVKTTNNNLPDNSSKKPLNATAFSITDLLLLFTALIWGINYPVIKFALEDFLPLAFSAPRFLVASICMAVVLAFSKQGFKVAPRHLLPMFLFGLAASTINQSLITIGMTYTKAGNAALILGITPIFTAIISRLRKHEQFTSRAVLGLAVAFTGLALITLAGSKEVNFAESLKGDLMLLFAAMCWSIYTIGTSHFAHIYGSLKSATIMMLLGTPMLCLVSTPMLIKQNWAAVRPVSWIGMIASGVMSIALCFILWNYCVKKIGATRSAIYSNIQPVFAMVAAYPMIGETPTWGQVLGAMVIFGGIYLVRTGMMAHTREELIESEEEEITSSLGKG
jgi:drug/metabolite transporter (DMT)-like permease